MNKKISEIPMPEFRLVIRLLSHLCSLPRQTEQERDEDPVSLEVVYNYLPDSRVMINRTIAVTTPNGATATNSTFPASTLPDALVVAINEAGGTLYYHSA